MGLAVFAQGHQILNVQIVVQDTSCNPYPRPAPQLVLQDPMET